MTVAIAIQLSHIHTVLGGRVIHDDISLQVATGEVLALVGGSGSGKTTLLQHMIGLTEPAAGSVTVLGERPGQMSFMRQRALRRRLGVVFQFGALFGSLSVLENVMLPLKAARMPADVASMVARLKLDEVGIASADLHKPPSALSGGMVKRVALARSLALDPELLFLDEPTSGLDPLSAQSFVDLILETRQRHQLTAVMVTHDLARMRRLVDRVAVLADRKLVAIGTLAQICQVQHPFIQSYFGAEFATTAGGNPPAASGRDAAGES